MRRSVILFSIAMFFAMCLTWRFFYASKVDNISHAKKQTWNRIVSLAPSFTETLIALKKSNHLVGVTAYCPKVDDANPVVVGTFTNPSLESILSLKPDLVLLLKHPHTHSIVAMLSDAQITVYVHEADSLADIFAINKDIAALFGTPERGVDLNKEMLKSIDQARQSLANHAHKTFLIFFGHHPLVAAGPSTYPAEILERLGLKNLVTSTNPNWPVWPREKLITSPPDFILIAEGPDAWPTYEKIFLDIWPKEKSPSILLPNRPVLLLPTVKLTKDIPEVVDCF